MKQQKTINQPANNLKPSLAAMKIASEAGKKTMPQLQLFR
jgi:hypothetical protein